MDMVWWMTQVISPYFGFINNYYVWVSVVTCISTAVGCGLSYEKLGFGSSCSDVLYLTFFIAVVTLVAPFLSVLLLIAAPLVLAIALVGLFGAAVFFLTKSLRVKLCQ